MATSKITYQGDYAFLTLTGATNGQDNTEMDQKFNEASARLKTEGYEFIGSREHTPGPDTLSYTDTLMKSSARIRRNQT